MSRKSRNMFRTMLGSTVDTCSCVSPRRLLDEFHTIFNVNVDSDPEVDSRPALQSRDFTALAGVFNAPDNLGKPCPCQPVDLDAHVERNTWMDQNKEVVAQQAALIEKSVQELDKEKQQVGLGWTSDIVNVHVDAMCGGT